MTTDIQNENEVHRVHKQLCGRTVPEFVSAFIKEYPKEAKEE
jgi:hypothetical protein